MKRMAMVSVAVLLLNVAAAPGHDYWLEPETFFPVVGKIVNVHLYVGEHFTSEAERSFQKKPTLQLQLISAKQTEDLTRAAQEGDTPAARITLARPGSYLVALERAPQHIKLEAEKFNKYLTEEGLDAILAQRKKAGEEQKEGRERYSRYLKCILQAGEEADDTGRRVLGQRLEIVPQANPHRLKVGDRLPVLVLFEGKPLAGVRLTAYHRVNDKSVAQVLTTSKEGLAVLTLEKAGPWLVRLVHMRRCEGVADTDWESFWGALSFGLR